MSSVTLAQCSGWPEYDSNSIPCKLDGLSFLFCAHESGRKGLSFSAVVGIQQDLYHYSIPVRGKHSNDTDLLLLLSYRARKMMVLPQDVAYFSDPTLRDRQILMFLLSPWLQGSSTRLILTLFTDLFIPQESYCCGFFFKYSFCKQKISIANFHLNVLWQIELPMPDVQLFLVTDLLQVSRFSCVHYDVLCF